MDSGDRAISRGAGRLSSECYIEECIYRCRGLGYPYTGVQYHDYCFCGSSYNKHGPGTEESCNTPCRDETQRKCGGGWRNSVYRSGMDVSKYASQKLDFLARAYGFLSSSHLLTTCKSQFRRSLEYCSCIWGDAPKSTLCLLDKIQFKAICLINNASLTKSLQSLSHRRLVGDLSIFY